jgi:CheY-like chemotaxis protein
MRILVVDDSADSLLLMRIELEQLGHTVVTSDDGCAALEIALAEPPDLLVSDIRLPVMDGLELVRHFRAEPRLQAVPAIAVTGLSSARELAEMRKAGFTSCLVKPVEFVKLATEIELVSRKARTIRGV